MKKWFSLKRLYFTLISIAWIIWMLIGYGNLIYSRLNGVIITDQEYLVAWNYSYKLQECTNPTYKPDWKAYTKTEEEMKKCKEEAESSILQSRWYERKTSVINWIVRWTLFLILFVTHFPIMMRKEKD